MLSASALCNNIGAYLFKKGDVTEGLSYLTQCVEDSACESKRAGMVWFFRKLKRQSRGEIEEIYDDGSLEHASCHGTCTRRGSAIVEAVMTHEPVVNENTPLGFEYCTEPVFVDRNEDTKMAAYINLACIQYASAINAEDVQLVLRTLEKAKLAQQRDVSGDNKIKNPFLNAVYHSNVSVCLIRLSNSNAKDALHHVEKSYSYLDEFRIRVLENDTTSLGEDEEEDVYIQRLYILMEVLLNHTRLCVRINDTERAMSLLEELAAASHRIPSKINFHHKHHHDHHHHHNHVTPIINRMRWIAVVADLYIMGMIHQRAHDYSKALIQYSDFLAKARHELGHDHMHVATILYFKGMVLFEQRKLHQALLAQLACLKIHESRLCSWASMANKSRNNVAQEQEMARAVYAVARTLHDREEYHDGLRMYTRALELQTRLAGGVVSFDALTTMCNLARVHHIIGDVDASLRINYKIVMHAKRLAGADTKHPFVADRLVVLGNVLVEAGRMHEAVKSFAEAARIGGGAENLRFSPASPYDVDGRAAASLAKAGLQHPGAATA